jgi:lipopolysaccharide export LptBFGC system permease protein LptF
MLPLVCTFAIPIASSLAVGITVGNLFSRDEIIILKYFPGARKKLELSVWLFSFLLLIMYVPFLFQLAPDGYWEGKRFLVRAAQTQIENLPARTFHKIASRCTIFFREKDSDEPGNTIFNDILLMVRQKNNKQYVVTANFAVLKKGVLCLQQGTIYNGDNSSSKECVAAFKNLDIAFEKMFFDANKKIIRPTKFLTWRELILSAESDNKSWQELHKRVGQVIWQILLPFLMLWAMMIFGRPKSNLLLSVVVSGSFFLFSYISLNMAYFFLNRLWSSLIIFYSIPLLIATFFYILYRRVI